MLRYEVNKNAAITQKAENNSPYQFELIDERKNKALYIIGNATKSFSNLTKYNYEFENFDNVNIVFNALEERVQTPSKLPAAIICDLNLADGKAFDLFEKIQKNHFLKSIPFIITTDTTTDEDLKKAKELGVDDFYLFPFNVEDIHNRISFLQQFKQEKSKINFSDQIQFENKTSLLKRSFDIIASIIALILLSPLLLMVAIAIKLESKGPVLYVSKRVGTGYQIFNLYKFRSMRAGADVELKKLMHLNQYGKNNKEEPGTFFKLDNDPRVTLLGRFLRASSIDEIPQLLNVINGDMSIVGNRPLPLYEAEQLTKDVWAKRFLAPAGLTGLWQVSRRGQEEMSVAERVILDNTYADRHSFWLDLKIILKTFPALISKINV